MEPSTYWGDHNRDALIEVTGWPAMSVMEPLPSEYGARCKVERCGWHESWSTQLAAQTASVWHVYDHHRDVWRWVMKEYGQEDRLPMMFDILQEIPDVPLPRPEMFGHRLEDWESQL